MIQQVFFCCKLWVKSATFPVGRELSQDVIYLHRACQPTFLFWRQHFYFKKFDLRSADTSLSIIKCINFIFFVTRNWKKAEAGMFKITHFTLDSNTKCDSVS